MKKWIVFGVFFTCWSFGTSSKLGVCEEPLPPKDFDFQKFYSGEWLDIYRTLVGYQSNTSCGSVKFSYNSNNVLIQNIGKQPIIGSKVDLDNDKFLKFTFPNDKKISKYYVLDTDYENYALVYSCAQDNLTVSERAWLLSRTNETPINAEEIIQKYNNVHTLLNQGIHCDEKGVAHPPSLPEATTTSTEQPDEIDIQAKCLELQNMPNLDLQKMFNSNIIWEEMKRFEKGSKMDGDSCGTMTFDFHSATLLLSYMSSHSNFSARGEVNNATNIRVQFNHEKMSDFYVVDTDYSSYAVVYSCLQAEAHTKIERSWVLVAGNAEYSSKSINNILANQDAALQVLFEDGLSCYPEDSTDAPLDTFTIPGDSHQYIFYSQLLRQIVSQ